MSVRLIINSIAYSYTSFAVFDVLKIFLELTRINGKSSLFLQQ
uniref:Uncharacterized protein n=1 Tax=Bartonella rochalimae ATCC BAA-1498 TaxID=685782 RepID=E6YK01_9HYPH|nr:hypothetical protein BARRO_10122 [Bartonella rochalimae ATCC BAA-1498]